MLLGQKELEPRFVNLRLVFKPGRFNTYLGGVVRQGITESGIAYA